MLTFDAFLDRLEGVEHAGPQYMALCPAHQDTQPSLAVRYSRGRIVLHCHRGCSFIAVLDAMHLQPADVSPERRFRLPAATQRIITARYDYTNEHGDLLFQVVRFDPKDFRQRRQLNGQWIWDLEGVVPVPYHLPNVLKAISDKRPVWIVEGEKDAQALGALGCTATCNAGGAGKWRTEFARYFGGANVILVPDNDEPGRRHMIHVGCSLLDVAKRIRRIELPDVGEHGDISDWLALLGERVKLEKIERLKALLHQAGEIERHTRTPEENALRGALSAAGKRLAELVDDPFLTEGELRRRAIRDIRHLLLGKEE